MLGFLEKPLVRLPVYAGFGFVVFMIAVVATFPAEQIKDIVAVEIEKQLGGKYSVEIGDLDIWWLSGVSLENVTIAERVDPSEVEKPSPEEEEEGLPEDLPMKVTIPSIAGRLAPIDSILHGPSVAFALDVGGGVITGRFSQGSDARKLYVDLGGIDLRKTLALTAFLGIPFFGDLDGEIDLELDPKKPMVTGGSINITGDKLTVGPATIKTDKFPPITYLEIPQTNFGTLNVDLRVADDKEKKRMRVEAFKWSGRDIRGELWGTVDLANRVEQASPDVEMRLQLDENFVTKNSLGPLLNVAEVRRGKNKDWFGFHLYGRLKNLKFKGSPKSAAGPPAGGPAGGEEEPEEAKEE